MTSSTSPAIDVGARKRGLDGLGAEFMGRHVGESAVERADGRAGGGHDDDIGHETMLPSTLHAWQDRAVPDQSAIASDARRARPDRCIDDVCVRGDVSSALELTRH